MIKQYLSKLTVRLFFTMLVSGVAGVLVFCLLWGIRLPVYQAMRDHHLLSSHRGQFISDFAERAAQINVRPTNEEEERQLWELIQGRDEYTGISIYDAQTGEYITGYYAPVLDDFITGSLLNGVEAVYLTDDETVQMRVAFQDQEADVYFYSYYIAQIMIPYLVLSLLISLGVFLFPILHFVRRRMEYLCQIEEEILVMAEGDLSHPVTVNGTDEIAVLASQLNSLRIALDENISQEKESRGANRDLISAMSHDLKTPLTTLTGYLEIIKRKRCSEEKREEYLDRCLKKVEDIRELSDRMFEYALVFEQSDTVEFSSLLLTDIKQNLIEHIDFIELAGFRVKRNLKVASGSMQGNGNMIKRIFSNLFSNVLKYGDKNFAVEVEMLCKPGQVVFSLRNRVKEDDEQVESNRIGLKSVKKMVSLHHGELYVMSENGIFSIQITLPVS